MKKNKIIFYWLPVILWATTIFILSSISDFSSVPGQAEGRSDVLSSIAHIVIFAIMCWLLIRALIVSGIKKRKAVAWGFIITIIYGALDEFHQYFVPGREVHLSDWLMDAIGAFFVLRLYKSKIKTK